MVHISSILCPLDLSETSVTTFNYATMLSRWYGASLTAIEMIWIGVPSLRPTLSPLILAPGHLNEYTAELEQFVDDHRPAGLHVDVVVREGPMVTGILDEARKRQTDLIVLGTHGRGGFEKFVLGSVTEKILRKAACPVFTVPPAAVHAPPTAQPFQAILCPVDFSPSSIKALRYALSLAQESGKRLILVHVVEGPIDRHVLSGTGPAASAARRHLEEAAQRELRAAVSEEARQWCNCLEVTATGRPYEEILRVADEQRADLIVMGVHGRNALELALFGSTANQVVRRATCPVLTIR